MSKILHTAQTSGARPRIIFFGNERIATGVHTDTPVIKALLAAGYDVQAIISNVEPGTSRRVRTSEIAEIAHAHNIPLLSPQKLSDIQDDIRALDPDIGVLVAYGKMIPDAIIALFPFGIVNIHPSALPLHRGPTPVESVILGGSAETAVSIMQLVKAMDAGPVFAQKTITLSGKETKQALADSLLLAGKDLLINSLPGILRGTLLPAAQDESKATYDTLIAASDGIIDWGKPAERLERELRAYAQWPRSRTKIANKDVVITAAHISKEQGAPGHIAHSKKQLTIYCGNDALVIDSLQPAGKKEMSGEAFLAGHRHLL